MEMRVSGHQVEIGEAFRTHVSQALGAMTQKYFARSLGANVTLSPGPHDAGFVCDILVQVTQGLILKGTGRANDTAQHAFDVAAQRIDKQLRRYKRRLVDRDRQGPREVPSYDAGYVIFQNSEAQLAEDEDVAADNPLVVAEARVDIPEASVSDAVMMLDLRNTTALLFRNSVTGAFNMVYRREDGNIGWVEPKAG